MKGLKDLRDFVEKSKVESKNYRIWSAKQDNSENSNVLLDNMPIKVGKGVWQNYLLEGQIKLELGGNNTPSTAIAVCTTDENVIIDGRICLIGPDISEISGSSNSFGLIAIAAGKKITPEFLNKIKRRIYFTDEIEGVLLRTTPRRYIIRISKDVYNRQLSFEHIGRAIIWLFREKFPELIGKMELVFITAGDRYVEQLEIIGRDVNKIFSEALQDTIYKYAKKYEKLRNDCDLEEECDVCDNQSICEEIQEIIRIREDTKTIRQDEDRTKIKKGI